MKKMSTSLRDKILLQAHEATEQGLTKLGSTVIAGLCLPQTVWENTKSSNYNHDELVEVVQHSLWSAAMQVAAYHNLPNLDIQKIEPLIVEATDKFINQIECSYDVENKLGPFEETVPGQTSNK